MGLTVFPATSSSDPGLLATVTIATDVGTKQAIYTVPAGYKCYLDYKRTRDATADMSGAAYNYTAGWNAGADNYPSFSLNIAGLTDNTKFEMCYSNNDINVVGAAGNVFGIIFTDTGITASVTIDLYGLLIAV